MTTAAAFVAPVDVGVDRVSVVLGDRRVLDAVSLDVAGGEWLGIAGPNGAGKTTLLRVLAMLARHTGAVTVGGDELAGLSTRARARRVAYVPQDPVIPAGMSVLDYALLGRTPHLGRRLTVTVDDERIAWNVLERLELVRFSARTLASLSGGERQRAVLARALAQDAAVLLLDEPTASLDLGHQQEVLGLVEGLRRERGLTVIMTAHDLTLAARCCDRIAVLRDGRLVAVGSPPHVLEPELLAAVYGARVRVLQTEDGPVVVPTGPR